MLKSSVCRYEHFESDWYGDWCNTIGFDPVVYPEAGHSYRKMWEWAAIFSAIKDRGYAGPGRRGLGFAVGTEWLPSVFANLGADIIASDLHEDRVTERWTTTNQHAASLNALFHEQCISRADFDERVAFQPVDMNDISDLASEQADFIWSSCAIEHLGSLDAGMTFVKEAMRLVKPGGLAVHTTEFNCSSDDATIEEGWNVIYRQRDIERLARDLVPMRCGLTATDFFTGDHQHDLNFDVTPYFANGSPHIKLLMDGHIATSFVLIIKKAW